jgi:subtilisin-like proprotein convertase family protein
MLGDRFGFLSPLGWMAVSLGGHRHPNQPDRINLRMKTIAIVILLLTTKLSVMAQLSFTNAPNLAIPDGNPLGLTTQITVSGLTGGIANVQVALDITGGFNGDLYAYLVGPQGQLAVLLNRSGVTGLNAYGYANPGFNITLDGAATNNIHNYQDLSPVYSGGQLTGTWAADGRNINPLSAGSVFDSAGTLANLGVFNNTTANGEWTLFVADLGGGGGTANLHNVILTIVTVPEPSTWTLLAGSLVGLKLWRRRK